MNAFRYLRKVNKSRDLMMHEKLKMEVWNGTDYGCAAAGEMGEACNIVKKMRRMESRIQPSDSQSKRYEELRWRLGEELADTILYVDLLAAHYDIDLWDQIVKKFNVGSGLLSAPHVLTDEERPDQSIDAALDRWKAYSARIACEPDSAIRSIRESIEYE